MGKAQSKALDSMQVALETETKSKAEEEPSAKSAAADAKVTADRRAAAVANGLEEARALLETADRQRRAAEQELADTNETLADLTNVKSYKKQIEEAEEIAALNLAKYR